MLNSRLTVSLPLKAHLPSPSLQALSPSPDVACVDVLSKMVVKTLEAQTGKG